ncbi:hypothetical protein ZWY2020_031752 [Hordeum vulgare]|nr:hypothetical protein ZWY2020_031752 [Hordeum vulgare]
MSSSCLSPSSASVPAATCCLLAAPEPPLLRRLTSMDSASDMTAAVPRTSIDRHTTQSFAQPPTNADIAGTPPTRRTTSKPTKLMIPNVGTNPPATQTPDEGR